MSPAAGEGSAAAGTIPTERRRQCADSALQCFGTAYIFEKRTRPIRLGLLSLSFLGIAGPAALGAIVATFNLKKPDLEVAVTVAGIIGIAQLIVSIWALVATWGDNLAYYIESKVANYRLASEYDQLGKTQMLTPTKFDLQFQLLEKEGQFRADSDGRRGITDREKRMGMRAGLRQFRRPCAGCGSVPLDVEPSNCQVCGNF